MSGYCERRAIAAIHVLPSKVGGLRDVPTAAAHIDALQDEDALTHDEKDEVIEVSAA